MVPQMLMLAKLTVHIIGARSKGSELPLVTQKLTSAFWLTAEILI